MTPHGQRQIEAAKADGRWDAAYAPMRASTVETLPEDLLAAIQANPRAQATLLTLNRPNLFSLGFRVSAMKTESGRANKIATLVAMLARGETILPNGSSSAATKSVKAKSAPKTKPAPKAKTARKKVR
jgi:uncharacterized protein YdeI (YjbR/CyaY-like superfamily)